MSLPDTFKVANLTKEYYIFLGIGPADSNGKYKLGNQIATTATKFR